MSSSSHRDSMKPGLSYSYPVSGYSPSSTRDESLKRSIRQVNDNYHNEQQQSGFVGRHFVDNQAQRPNRSFTQQQHILQTSQQAYPGPCFNRGVHVSQRSSFIPKIQNTLFNNGIDVVEFKSEYRIYIDMPSVQRESIKVLVQRDGLRVEGCRKLSYTGYERVIFRRRYSGSFCVFIPFDYHLVSIDNASATFSNGELCVILNKVTAPNGVVGALPDLNGSPGSVQIQQLHSDRRVTV